MSSKPYDPYGLLLYHVQVQVIFQDPQLVVNGHPLTSRGLLMDTLFVMLVNGGKLP